MTTSTMAALKTNLKVALLQEGTLAGVQVLYGDPGGLGQKEVIWLGSTETGSQEIASLRSGKKRRRESYLLHVYVEVMSKATPEANEARAVALAGVLEDLVATDPKVSDTPNLLFCFVEGYEMDTTEVGGTGPRTVIDVSLQCEGNLL